MRPFLVALLFVCAPWLLAGAAFATGAGSGAAGAASASPTAAGDSGAAAMPEHLELWVRVARGRAELVGQGPRSHVDELGVWRHVDGRGELRLEARAEASVRWAGHASVDLVGPTRVRFEPDERGGLRVELLELARTSIELRRGSLELSLAGGWQARITPGVAALEPRGSSRFTVERVVGEPLCFERFGPGRAARVELGHGGRVELAYDAATRPSSVNREAEKARAAVWADVRWPWRERPADSGPSTLAPGETVAGEPAAAEAAAASAAALRTDAAAREPGAQVVPDASGDELPVTSPPSLPPPGQASVGGTEVLPAPAAAPELVPVSGPPSSAGVPWASIFSLAWPLDSRSSAAFVPAAPLDVGLVPAVPGLAGSAEPTRASWLDVWLAGLELEGR
ncbi:MAG: hypothetical protein L6Q99_00365 [Planctomycetes bacterium]|nr:hypothetical protein [Planctomycetota bacterium]